MTVNPFPGPMQPWPALASCGRHVQLPGGRRLFVFESGDPAAPALLLVHGLGDEADSWRHVLAPLAERYHVVAPDLPGFGRSDPLPRYSLPAIGDALLGLLDALRLASAVWLGNSLGAIVAQAVALRAPGRAAGLILVDGTLAARSSPRSRSAAKRVAAPRGEERAGSINWATLLMALPFVGDRIYTGYRRDPQAAYDSLRPFYADLDALPQADRDFLFQRVNERVWSGAQRSAYLGLLRSMTWSAPWRLRGLSAGLAKLDMPTWLLWGERDRIWPLAAAQALLAAQPAARLSVIPGAGHLPHQEQPRAFLAALENLSTHVD